jgi:hypothetical protein
MCHAIGGMLKGLKDQVSNHKATRLVARAMGAPTPQAAAKRYRRPNADDTDRIFLEWKNRCLFVHLF